MSDSIYNAQSTSVSNGTAPNNGRVFNFLVTLIGAPVAFDLKPLVNLNRIDNVQGIFIDNSQGTQTCVVSTSIGQNIRIPAGSQGVMPIYLSADKVITFQGYGSVPVVLLNFSTPAAVWSAGSAAGPSYTSGGLLETSDVALDALISGGGLNVNVLSGGGGSAELYGNADVIYRPRTGKTFWGYATNGGTKTIFSGSQGIFVTGWQIYLGANSSGSGVVGVRLAWASEAGTAGYLFERAIDMDKVTSTTDGAVTGWLITQMDGLDLVSPSQSGDGLNIVVDGGISSGSIAYTVFGGTTQYAS